MVFHVSVLSIIPVFFFFISPEKKTFAEIVEPFYPVR